MSGDAVVTRFAPSPTGPLHLGHVAAARAAWQAGDRVLLRLEDIDQGRCRAEFAAWIVEDLEWLGLVWDGPVRVQSRHLAEYGAALDRLEADGLVYPCFCSRRDIAAADGAAHGVGPVYRGTCRALSTRERSARVAAGGAYARRLNMAEAVRRTGRLRWHEVGEGWVEARPELFGDVVLGRRDTPGSYHLCVTHDDALQGVTLVTRGVDLREATGVHRVLQALLGWEAPAYAHHPLLVDAAGRRLSKRAGAMSVRTMREQGATAAEVWRTLGP